MRLLTLSGLCSYPRNFVLNESGEKMKLFSESFFIFLENRLTYARRKKTLGDSRNCLKKRDLSRRMSFVFCPAFYGPSCAEPTKSSYWEYFSLDAEKIFVDDIEPFFRRLFDFLLRPRIPDITCGLLPSVYVCPWYTFFSPIRTVDGRRRPLRRKSRVETKEKVAESSARSRPTRKRPQQLGKNLQHGASSLQTRHFLPGTPRWAGSLAHRCASRARNETTI